MAVSGVFFLLPIVLNPVLFCPCKTKAPLEVSIDAVLDGFERISVDYTWPVHIPADGNHHGGTTFSLHLSDGSKTAEGEPEVPMACADLIFVSAFFVELLQ